MKTSASGPLLPLKASGFLVLADFGASCFSSVAFPLSFFGRRLRGSGDPSLDGGPEGGPPGPLPKIPALRVEDSASGFHSVILSLVHWDSFSSLSKSLSSKACMVSCMAPISVWRSSFNLLRALLTSLPIALSA